MLVVAQARGAGVGTALVRTVTDWADAHELRRILLATRDAHGVYRPFGFTDPEPGLLMARNADVAALYGG